MSTEFADVRQAMGQNVSSEFSNSELADLLATTWKLGEFPFVAHTY